MSLDVASLILQVCSLMVWFVYAHLLYAQYSRRLRPNLLIDYVMRNDIDAVCMVINMSEQPINVECVLLAIDCGDEPMVIRPVSTMAEGTEKHGEDAELQMYGPLTSGDQRVLGRFRSLLRTAGALVGQDGRQWIPSGGRQRPVERFEIRVVARYSAEREVFGVQRSFSWVPTPRGHRILPQIATDHLVSRKQRAEARQWLERAVASDPSPEPPAPPRRPTSPAPEPRPEPRAPAPGQAPEAVLQTWS